MVKICKLGLLIDWVFKKINGQILSTVRAEKDLFFDRFSEKMCTPTSQKSLNNSWNIGPIGIKIGQNDPSSSSKNLIVGNFDISFFCDFIGQKASNLPQNGQNLVLSRHKIAKNWNIKISHNEFFPNFPLMPHTKFQLNRTLLSQLI